MEIESEEDWTLECVRQQQEECPTISQVNYCLKSKTTLKTSDKELEALAFIGNDGVIRRKSKDGKVLIIVPQKLTSRGLKIMHDDQGHFCYSKTLKRSQEMYFWPKISSQIDEWCKKCRVCQQRRNPVPANRAPLQPITTRQSG